MRNNYKNLGGILKLGNALEIDLIRFKPINVFWIGGNSDLAVETGELKNEVKKLIEMAKHLKIKHNLEELLNRIETNFYQRPFEKIPCFSPWTELYIQYYGGIRLCCEFYSKKYDIGNILEEDFQKIWNGSRMRQIRKEFIKGNTYFPVCKNCNRFQKNILIYDRIKNRKVFL